MHLYAPRFCLVMPSQNLATYLSECTNENQNLTSLDLSSVTSKVATSLREAEVTIQSSLAALSAEISDDDRDRGAWNAGNRNAENWNADFCSCCPAAQGPASSLGWKVGPFSVIVSFAGVVPL